MRQSNMWWNNCTDDLVEESITNNYSYDKKKMKIKNSNNI